MKKNLALDRIKKMKAYLPPLEGRANFPGTLLDFNERTVEPSERVLKAIGNLIKERSIKIYPEYSDLEKHIADYVGVNLQQVMVTNGSDHAIDVIFRTFTEAGDKVIIPKPSFAMFYQYAGIIGNGVVSPLYDDEDLSYPLREVLNAIDEKTKLIVVCNPNNPTGTIVSLREIGIIAEAAPSAIILVDEAYFEFSKLTAVSLIKKYPNVIVTRTFSKAFGLAGLRVGYLIADVQYVSEMLKVRGPYDVNIFAYYSAIAALESLDEVNAYAEEVMSVAKPLVEKFFLYNKIKFYESHSNYILFKPENFEKVASILKENGFLVRPQNKDNIKGTLRVSIGTEKQMRAFIKVYEEKVLAERNPKQKYAFLDRDGTLIFEPPDTFQIDSLEKLKLLDGVIKGLKALQQNGYKLVIVSNQNGIGTPSFPKEDFEIPHARMLEIFSENGIEFKKVFICPHFPEDNCECRKPKLGLVKEFLNEINLDKENSFMCGDRETDGKFAENLGIKFLGMPTNGDFFEAIKTLI